MVTRRVRACIVSGALASVLLSGCSAAVSTRAKAVPDQPQYSAHWRLELDTTFPSAKPISAKHVALAKSIGKPTPAVLSSPATPIATVPQQDKQRPSVEQTVMVAGVPDQPALFSTRILFPVWSLIDHSTSACSHSSLTSLSPETKCTSKPSLVSAKTKEIAKTKGIASWYGSKFHGHQTANGEIFNQNRLTAAHRTLPMGTKVTVTNPRNGKSVEVRINDRGPYVKGREIDLSYAAARALDLLRSGLEPVVVKVLTSP